MKRRKKGKNQGGPLKKIFFKCRFLIILKNRAPFSFTFIKADFRELLQDSLVKLKVIRSCKSFFFPSIHRRHLNCV